MRYDVLNKVTVENWEKLYVEYLMEMVQNVVNRVTLPDGGKVYQVTGQGIAWSESYKLKIKRVMLKFFWRNNYEVSAFRTMDYGK